MKEIDYCLAHCVWTFKIGRRVKPQSVLNWLVPLIAVLAIIMSTAGLFTPGGNGPYPFTTIHGNTVEMDGQGLYRNDSLFVAALLRGTDTITLLVSVPLLLASYWFYRRGSMRGNIFMAGMLTYFLYVGFTYTFSVIFNAMFLVYVAVFSASLFATITALATFDIHMLSNNVSAGFPQRGIAIFMGVAGLGTLTLWLSELIGPIMNGQAPMNLGPYTTMFTHGFDNLKIPIGLNEIFFDVTLRNGLQRAQRINTGSCFFNRLFIEIRCKNEEWYIQFVLRQKLN